jgi:N4-gp56 family major capsid protein
MVDMRPVSLTNRGSSSTINFNQFFAAAAVTTAKTPLSEEADPDSVKLPATTTVVLTPTEYGLWTMRTEKLAKRGLVQVDPVIATTVAASCADVIDELIQDVVLTSPTNTLFDKTNSHSTIVTTTATDLFRADVVRRAVLGLRSRSSVPTDGSLYTCIASPAQVFDLRTETGAANWTTPNQYGSDQSRIWQGEVGVFEGVHFIESPRARTALDGAASAKVSRAFFFGQEAIAEDVITEPELRLGPYTDAFNRFRKLGWYMDIAWAVGRQESLAVAYTGTTN